MTNHALAVVVVLVLTGPTLLCASTSAQQPPPSGGQFRLTAVQVAGARRYTPTEVTRVSGLQTGESLTVTSLDAAANRLAKSGLFQSVNYKYATAGRDMTLTLEIVEAEWTVPVVFDNFVWFTDDELTTALAQVVPSFDRTAPALPDATEFIARALQALLTARGVDRRVGFVTSVDLKQSQQLVFKVEPGPKLCAVTLVGEVASKDPEFSNAVRPSIGKDYSRAYLTSFSNGTLLNLYRRRGYWKTTFATPSAVVSEGACSGVTATLRANEGASYAWERAEWTGNAVLTSDDLNKLLQIQSGQVANITQIDDELRRVHDAYGKRGYILQTGSYTPRLDDAARRAVFQVSIAEGAQFFMGTIEFAGISEGDARNLRGRWRLKAGDVFDESYLLEFRRDELVPFERRMTPQQTADLETRLDQSRHLVNLKFVYR